jgi:hypothetical protein
MELDQTGQQLMVPPDQVKGIELSRVSGDLVFTDEEESERLFAMDPKAREQAEKHKIENVQAWIKDKTDKLNQRTFNVNEILGNFPREWTGRITNRDHVLRKSHFKDLDGQIVNDRGYLINEDGDIISKYTYETVFKRHELLGKNKSEIPLPYRMEKYNFNPHECIGNFDYNDKQEPIIMKHAGGIVDNNLRPVNRGGWLIDKYGNIVDNQGQVKFLREQLDKGKDKDNECQDLAKFYNFDGRRYKIKNIIGQFKRDRNSKEIILCYSGKNDFVSKDLLGRKVNPKGYLVDRAGNIIDKNDQIIWRAHELMYNEPPKICEFTEFSMTWIRGNTAHDVKQNPQQNDEYDLDGRRINSLGYLIDQHENIVDVFGGNCLFKSQVLEKWSGGVKIDERDNKFRGGQEAEIPWIFRSKKLLEPELDAMERELRRRRDRVEGKTGPGYVDDQMDIDDEDVFRNLGKLDHSLGLKQAGKLSGAKDFRGREIDDILPDAQDAHLYQEDQDGSFDNSMAELLPGQVLKSKKS